MFPCKLVVFPCRTPPVTVVPPEYVLGPVKICIPAPCLVKEPVPLMNPGYVVVIELFTVRFFAPKIISPLLPVPLRAPIIWEVGVLNWMSSVDELIVIAPEAGSRVAGRSSKNPSSQLLKSSQ